MGPILINCSIYGFFQLFSIWLMFSLIYDNIRYFKLCFSRKLIYQVTFTEIEACLTTSHNYPSISVINYLGYKFCERYRLDFLCCHMIKKHHLNGEKYETCAFNRRKNRRFCALSASHTESFGSVILWKIGKFGLKRSQWNLISKKFLNFRPPSWGSNKIESKLIIQ